VPITTVPDTAETPENFDSSIPVLTDVIAPGRPDRARVAPRAPEPVLSPAAAPSHEELAHGADQVALALETELTQWVREAVADELERRGR
jgi:hypothetical protein